MIGPAAAMPDEPRLRRFARLAAPLLRGEASRGIGPRAARNRAGPGLEFLDLRDYAAGDDVRHLDWHQSARRGRPMVRRYRDESAADWYLCLDASASMGIGRKWPFAAALVTAMAYALVQAGHRTALILFADRLQAFLPPGRGPRQFASLTRTLLEAEPAARGGDSLPGLCARLIRQGGNLVLVSDLLRSDRMESDLRRLAAAAATGSILQVLAARETEVAIRGPARLYDIETGDERRLTVSPSASEGARLALSEYVARLQHRCVSLGLHHSVCRDDEDWERALLRHLGA